MKRNILAAAILAAALAVPALAQDKMKMEGHDMSGSTAKPGAAALVDGEVRKVDKDAKKITIRHGPIQNLDMPPMTMVFQVKDAQMLEQVKPGDKVRFEAQKLGGAFTVTRIEAAK